MRSPQIFGPFWISSLYWSLGLHMTVAVLMITLPSIFWFQARGRSIVTHTTIRVDLVELPQKAVVPIEHEQRVTQQTIQKIEKTIKESYVDPKALKLQTKTALKKIKKEAEFQSAKRKALQTLAQQQVAAKKEQLRRGNILSEGSEQASSLQTGEALHAYVSVIHDKVKLRWALPFYLRSQEHWVGSVTIYLDTDGVILRRKITPSGNADFDHHMHRAIDEALPLDAVPDVLQKQMRYEGLTITFYAKELRQ